MAGHLKRAGWFPGMLLTLIVLGGCASSPSARLRTTIDQQQQAGQAYADGKLMQALSGYQALTATHPQNADFWFRLGNVNVRLERPDDAVVAYQHVLQIEPSHAKAWHNLGIIRLRQAEAAFAQSAQTAAGVDASLQQESATMVHGIAGLGSAPADSTPVLSAVPSTPATGQLPSSATAPAAAASAGVQP